MSNGEIFAVGAIQGFIIELFLAGNLSLAWFLGGPALGIYGMMMAAVGKKDSVINEHTVRQVLLVLLLGTLLCFIGAIFGAIIGDTIYNSII